MNFYPSEYSDKSDKDDVLTLKTNKAEKQQNQNSLTQFYSREGDSFLHESKSQNISIKSI